MADWYHLLQTIFIGLIFSYLLAKLISVVTSFKDENLSITRDVGDDGESSGAKPESKPPPVAFRPKEAAEIFHGDVDSVIAEQGSARRESLAGSDDEDDDWEGVESTELDEIFSAATAFVAAAAADRQKVSSEMQLQLYGLYKIATEGPCTAPQPSAIKITARAKWQAWQKLGAMPPEEAMEKYVDIVTELYPSWLAGANVKSRDEGGDGPSATSSKGPMGPVFSSFVYEEDSGNDSNLDAIHDFSREGEIDNLLKCVESGVSVNLKDSEGRTPLHWAVDRGHLRIAELLISKSADINAKDNEGQTPLHYAAVCERQDIAEYLVKQNADTNAKDNDDKTPYDLCESKWVWMQCAKDQRMEKPYLGRDVVVQILSKLPVKSLMRFKCVSKEWLSLINEDSLLISTHLHRQSMAHKLSILTVEACTKSNYRKKTLLLGEQASLEDLDRSYLPNCSLSHDYDDNLTLVGTCDGLVCFSLWENQENTVTIWNPATKQVRALPKLKVPEKYNLSRITGEVGFGFDLNNDNGVKVYKVFRFLRTETTVLGIDVFDLSSHDDDDCWREVIMENPKTIAPCKFPTYPSIFARGELHWHICCYDYVLSFDVRRQQFHHLDLPPNPRTSSPRRQNHLAKWKDSLAFLDFLDFWTLNIVTNDDTKSYLWVKLFTIDHIIREMFIRRPFLCGVWKDQYVLLEPSLKTRSPERDVVLMYDESSSSFVKPEGLEKLEHCNYEAHRIRAHDYVESLVSVYPQKNPNYSL